MKENRSIRISSGREYRPGMPKGRYLMLQFQAWRYPKYVMQLCDTRPYFLYEAERIKKEGGKMKSDFKF